MTAADARARLCALLSEHLPKLKKAVFSLPRGEVASAPKITARPTEIGGQRMLQLEALGSDGKATHRNIAPEDAAEFLAGLAVESFGQTNLIFTSGAVQLKVSKKGSCSITGSVGKGADEAPVERHNREKNYLIDAEKYPEFLSALGVCDSEGRVFDKKHAKYRQINRFVELLDDVYGRLPAEGELTVCDLCCGKSYLTFAVWFYLTGIRGRRVCLYGVDLKSDVIDFCRSLAERLGCTGMHFLCQDILTFDPGTAVDLVISLHACDTATDIVLAYAIRRRARLILSTPCCHHELFHQLGKTPLSPVMKHSILKQKFADALTDSLRATFLEAHGYHVEALELIDPEETPKNVMIRAWYSGKISPFARREYEDTVAAFGLDPALPRLLGEAVKDSMEDADKGESSAK